MARPRQFDELAVLEAAMECFWVRGYEATSVRALIKKTGLTGALPDPVGVAKLQQNNQYTTKAICPQGDSAAILTVRWAVVRSIPRSQQPRITFWKMQRGDTNRSLGGHGISLPCCQVRGRLLSKRKLRARAHSPGPRLPSFTLAAPVRPWWQAS
jgi:hypothetical protein